MAARPRYIFLSGAPSTEDLSWDGSNLMHAFDAPFNRILNGQAKETSLDRSELTPSAPGSKWRAVELSDESNAHEGRVENAAPQTQFLSFGESGANRDSEHLDFLEHSVAVFDDLASSQILPRDTVDEGAPGLDTIIDFSTSFANTSETDSSFNTTEISYSPVKNANNIQDARISGAITNLKQIPDADHISRILPQTMTVNMLVGVVTVAPARTVHLKKSNAEMDIIELIVGDETRAGFTVSFWLVPAESQHKPADDLREVLRGLRAGDVILLQNVALSSFRNCVYGQSLSKRFSRNSTSITPMHDATVTTLPSNLPAKLQRVQDWANDFVGVGQNATTFVDSSQSGRGMADALPPDTQD